MSHRSLHDGFRMEFLPFMGKQDPEFIFGCFLEVRHRGNHGVEVKPRVDVVVAACRNQRLYHAHVLSRLMVSAEEIVLASEGNRLVATLLPKMQFIGQILLKCFNNWQMMMVTIFRMGAEAGKPPFHGLCGGGVGRGEAGSLLSIGFGTNSGAYPFICRNSYLWSLWRGRCLY